MSRVMSVPMIALLAVLVASGAAMAQLPVPASVWLKADDLITGGLNFGDPVNLWTDAASGVDFAPDLGSGDTAPTLVQRTVNGNSFAAVEFSQVGGTEVDRMRQQNQCQICDGTAPNLDPTNISNGEDMTLFVVFNPAATTTPVFNFQTIAAKRGFPPGDASPWTFGLQDGAGGPQQGRFTYVTFGGTTVYRSGNFGAPIPQQVWHVGGMQIMETGANDALDFFDDASEDPNVTATFLGGTNDGVPGTAIDQVTGANGPPRNGDANDRMMLSGSVQVPGERFPGDIAELIMFDSKLNTQQFAQVESYLNQKYFVIPEPTTALLAMVAFSTLVAGRRRRS